MKDIARRFKRACNKASKVRYFVIELVLSRVLSPKGLRILFSDLAGSHDLIRQGFHRTNHAIFFGEFTEKTIVEYDLVVPLTIEDIDRLNAMRPLIEKNPLPIPSDECVRLCDDKVLLNRFLLAHGFGELVPRVEGEFSAPYILKKRIDQTGKHSCFVLDEHQERNLLVAAPMEDYFRQEIVPGRFEYASHILFVGGRIIRSLSFEYELKDEFLIKGQFWPIEQKMISCPFPDLFTSILRTIGYEGLCCIDYKISDGRLYILEINPRFGGSLRPYFFSFIRSLKTAKAAGR